MPRSNPQVATAIAPVNPSHSAELWSGVLSCAFAAALVCGLSWFKLSDVDAGYHIAYGRHFLATGKIVERDPFLVEQNQSTFVNANWGSQVIMAWLDSHFGVTGLILLRSILLLVIFISIASIVRSICPSWHAVAWAWILAAIAGYEDRKSVV